jgi:hypothetical protein
MLSRKSIAAAAAVLLSFGTFNQAQRGRIERHTSIVSRAGFRLA